MIRLASRVSWLFFVLLLSPLLHAEGGIRGKVTLEGALPKPVRLPMSSDPNCMRQHPKGFRYEPIVVGPGGGLADVFVYVKSGDTLNKAKFDAPKEPAVILDQKGCWYYPRVVGVMVGQKLEILNSDPTIHNVNALPDFNETMPPGVKKVERTFSRPEVMRRLKCNVHPWMTAYVGVLEHPYHAVTDKSGRFRIQGLPPGKYMLGLWHERLGERDERVVVRKAGAAVEFSLPAAAGAR